jgi:protein O-GlcNAc transferase
MCISFLKFSRPMLFAVLVGLATPTQILAQAPSGNLVEADADYRAGVAALNRHDLQTAQAKFEEVIRLAPQVEQAYGALAVVFESQGKMTAAIAQLQKALAIKPGDTSAQLNLAAAYEQTGSPAKAVPLFAKAVAAARSQKQPVAAVILASYAHALAATGQHEAAIAQLKQAVAMQSSNPQMHNDLGSLYAQARDWQHAEHEFAEAIRLKPDFAAAHLSLGFVFQVEHKNDAMQEWLEASKLAPDDAKLALVAGKAIADVGQDDQALPILKRAHELDPQSTAASYQLALVLQRVNRDDTTNLAEAIKLLKSVVQADPDNADALANLGLALSLSHDARAAVPFLERAVALDAKNVTAHEDLSAAYLQLNQTADAIVELKAALQLEPDSPQLHYNLGAAYKLQDDAADAIPELEAAAKLDPTGYEPNYVLGVLYLQQARYAEAASRLEASLKLHPDNGDAWATLGSVYNKLDRLPEAVTALQEAIKQLPEQADPHLTLAAVLVKQNQTAQAADERKTAANLMRTHMNLQRAEVATNSGKSQMTAGKIDDAIQEFRNAITFDPDYAEAHAELANALEKQGKTDEATQERACAQALESSGTAPITPAQPTACQKQ